MSEDLLESMSQRLRIKGGRKDEVIRELHSHLDQGRMELESAGRSPEDAIRESRQRFGDPLEVADMLTQVYRPRLPRVKAALLGAVFLAGLSAWFGGSGTFASAQRHHHPHTGNHARFVHRGLSYRHPSHGRG